MFIDCGGQGSNPHPILSRLMCFPLCWLLFCVCHQWIW